MIHIQTWGKDWVQLWKAANCLVKFEAFRNFGPKIHWQGWFSRLNDEAPPFPLQEIYMAPILIHPRPILSSCKEKDVYKNDHN